MLILSIFLTYCIVSSVVCVFMSWTTFHNVNGKDKEKFERELEGIADALTNQCNKKWVFTKDDALVLFYLLGSFFGFIILPISVARKVIGLKK